VLVCEILFYVGSGLPTMWSAKSNPVNHAYVARYTTATAIVYSGRVASSSSCGRRGWQRQQQHGMRHCTSPADVAKRGGSARQSRLRLSGVRVQLEIELAALTSMSATWRADRSGDVSAGGRRTTDAADAADSRWSRRIMESDDERDGNETNSRSVIAT